MSRLPDFEKRQTAFRLYVRLRNVSRVSKETGIPVATIHVWKKEEQWEMKLADIQKTVSSQVEVIKEAQTNLAVKDQVSELQLLELLQHKVSNALVELNIGPTTWRDIIQGMEYISKEKRLILGQPTERATNTIEVSSMSGDELDKHIEQMQAIVSKQPEAAQLVSPTDDPTSS